MTDTVTVWWPTQWQCDDRQSDSVMTDRVTVWWPTQWQCDDRHTDSVMTDTVTVWWPTEWQCDDRQSDSVMTDTLTTSAGVMNLVTPDERRRGVARECFADLWLERTLAGWESEMTNMAAKGNFVFRSDRFNVPQNRVFLTNSGEQKQFDKLAVSHSLKISHILSVTWMYFTDIKTVRNLSLFWARLIQCTPFYFCQLHCCYPSVHFWSSKCFPFFRFSHQNPVCIYFPPVPATCPANLILLIFITITIFHDHCRSWWSTLCTLLHCPHYALCYTVHIMHFATLSTLCTLLHCPHYALCYTVPLLSATFPNTPFSNALSPFSSRIMRDQVSHPCRPYAQLLFCNYDTVSLVDFAPKSTVTMLNH